jgi:hypothetical protein
MQVVADQQGRELTEVGEMCQSRRHVSPTPHRLIDSERSWCGVCRMQAPVSGGYASRGYNIVLKVAATL